VNGPGDGVDALLLVDELNIMYTRESRGLKPATGTQHSAKLVSRCTKYLVNGYIYGLTRLMP